MSGNPSALGGPLKFTLAKAGAGMTKRNMTLLAQSIYKTLAFYDVQDFPLTLFEVRNYLIREPGLESVSVSLIQATFSELGSLVACKTGLYFLAGREELVEFRRRHYRTSLKRFIKIRRYLKPLRHFPYLRAVAISGSQALSNGGRGSDIDLFILTGKDRIWLTRAIVSFYFHLLAKRRHGKHIAGRFCLNHYLVEDVSIDQDRNLYTALEYASLLPILGERSWQNFWAMNGWVRGFLDNPVFQKHNLFPAFEFSLWQKLFERVLDFTLASGLNRLLGWYQKRRIKRLEHILVSDRELSFHPGSRGQQILARFQSKLDGF